MTKKHLRAERVRWRARVRERNAAGLCARCGAEPRKPGPKGKQLKNGAACIALEAGRVLGKRAAKAASA